MGVIPGFTNLLPKVLDFLPSEFKTSQFYFLTIDLGRKFSGGAAHSAQRHRRRVGVAAATAHWCGAERFLSGEPQSPPAAASTPRAVPGWTPARSAIPALAAGSQHLGQLLAEPPQGRHARAGDGLRQRLKGSRFSHHRARAAAGVPHAAVRHPLLPSLRSASLHRELGDRVG